MADEYLRREVARLHEEVAEITQMRKAELEHAQQERLDTRKMPPMAQMTRLQKRYFLEPWMTTLTMVFGTIAVVGYILGTFTRRHVEFCMVGLLFTMIAGGFLVTKMNFMEWNSKTEGEVRNRSRY